MVEVPGVSDRNQVLQLVGSTGQLLFLDPAGTTLSEGQNVIDLIGAGTINVLFDEGEIQQGTSSRTRARVGRSG